ncbi:leucyl aminopeptidase [Alterisphingorhabdus coralli]|uniref:Probable cytosol aminopeptidase n=1 Tax=Alterisphingorhabdus coralli TaxID=3071408 RepID=A0AA97F6A9_9SPHN|nr:leucyl aminopeptidase [Parasphingorhabdus sp. SCSIO 66989]WOE74256.1 leucyl aminopeptidase [Parasphingorhabdus sp. SCSIO 66989]
MQISFSDSHSADALRCYCVGSDDLKTASLPVDGHVVEAARGARFRGRAGDVFETFVAGDGAPLRVVLIGIGDKTAGARDLEKAGAALTARYLTSGVTAAHIDLAASPSSLSAENTSSLLTGILLRSWRFDRYRTTMAADAKPTLETLTVSDAAEGTESHWEQAKAIAEGVFLTRELVAQPANVLYPESFVERCEHLKELGVEIRVLDDAEMKELGMGALLGVAQGSTRPARILAMRWDGTDGADKTPVAFVGKGVTFDTGGISIKPAAGMEDMKWDMGGAGAVAGAMKALAGRKAKAHVIGICGLVENMPDGNAQRPGDVVTSMSGQTIEVINTDAEGRLVLCDALHWCQETYKPEYVIDLATLTGAIIISLGHEYCGMFSNDDGLVDMLNGAADASGDQVWRFPLGKPYDKLIDSPIADIKNVGPRGAGSITAAQFLQRFIQDGVKWAHLDIAGMAWADKPGAVWDKGATGYGVRLLDRLVAENFEQK